MQYLYRLTYICLILCTYILNPTSAELKDYRYLGLMHPSAYSPDGKFVVMLIENRYVGGSEFSLVLLALDPKSHTQNFGIHALTPDYKEVVSIPSTNNFAFLQYDPIEGYGIHLFMPDTLEQKRGFTYETDYPISKLQFSQDGQYYSYLMSFKSHPFESKSTKMKDTASRLVQPPGWVIKKIGEGLPIKTKKNKIIFSKTEKEEFAKWAPIEKPKIIPQLFTQPKPRITKDTQVEWAYDSKNIYVLDDIGIWSVSLTPYFPMWTKIVSKERIHRFQTSTKGSQILYEVMPDMKSRPDEENREDPHGLENSIWWVDLKLVLNENINQNPLRWELDVNSKITPRIIGKGWGAVFNPNGKTIIYANTDECKIINLETMGQHFVNWTTGKRLRY
ncbi:hypothetical protein JT359_02105 [Candidatus Poribacteria bacterium]|nr:hypothetical protein [Candidatus Poribacteria bacterium]